MLALLDWLSAALLAIGVLFMLLSAVGILRLPDAFTRMSAAAKAATLGIGAIYLATALHFGDLDAVGPCLAVIAFAGLTVPTAAHALGLAVYRRRVPLWQRTQFHGLPPEEAKSEEPEVGP